MQQANESKEISMNAQVTSIKGADVILAYHPSAGEPRRGEALLLTERGGDESSGVVAQVIDHQTASYPGDTESSIHELLEQSIADRLDIRQTWNRGEPWRPWNGQIPTRNVTVTPISSSEVLLNVTR
jgi:hypothetical protein